MHAAKLRKVYLAISGFRQLLYRFTFVIMIMETNYEKIATAIAYIETHFKEQPSLDDVAAQVHLSPFHFQRLFTEWAGVSPKKFLQYLDISYAKNLLKEKQATLFDTAFETGLSGTSRLHDLFINIESMTPGEYKNGGEGLQINYSYAPSPFGEMLVAATPRGICYMAFADDRERVFAEMKQLFPNAIYIQAADEYQQAAMQVFSPAGGLPQVKLHLKGTPFQVKVWEALLKIPVGGLTTYGALSSITGNAKAARATGSAVGDNPVAFLIPCHRVIRSTGVFGQYHWGSTRKTAIIGWEAASLGKDM